MLLKWRYKQATNDSSLYPQMLNESLDTWRKLGPSGCERLTRLWTEGHKESFFLTLGPCLAFKYSQECFHSKGVLLGRVSKHANDFLMRRLVCDSFVPVDISLEKGMEYSRVSCYALSGAELLDEQVHTESTTWWDIAAKLTAKDVDLAVVKFVHMAKEVSRAYWSQNIFERISCQEDEWQSRPPPKLVSVGNSRTGTPTTSRPKFEVKTGPVKSFKSKVVKRPATLKRPSSK